MENTNLLKEKILQDLATLVQTTDNQEVLNIAFRTMEFINKNDIGGNK